MELFKRAFIEDDAALFRELLERHPEAKARLNEPMADFDAPIITRVRSREMLDVLLEAGADINAKSRWWAGGFGLLHCAKPELAAYAVERGAIVDAHAAARLGMLDHLTELIRLNPEHVSARGGDGQTPLHFASTVEVANYLLDHGANINARDVDHESTPAQYMVRDRQHIARHLVRRGCETDIFLAAALGDADLVRKHLDANPNCVRWRVSDDYFPKANHKSGGTIYQWTLGWHVSAHQVARQFGHEDVYRLLMEHSPASVKLLVACWEGEDEVSIKSLLADHPGLVGSLSPAERRQMAHAARNNSLGSVRLMLAAGLPVEATGQHGGTPLHWAAWHGNAEMARAILDFKPPLEVRDRDFHATPIGWAIHGSENGWDRTKGKYGAVIEALLGAGAKLPEKLAGTEDVKSVLRQYGVSE